MVNSHGRPNSGRLQPRTFISNGRKGSWLDTRHRCLQAMLGVPNWKALDGGRPLLPLRHRRIRTFPLITRVRSENVMTFLPSVRLGQLMRKIARWQWTKSKPLSGVPHRFTRSPRPSRVFLLSFLGNSRSAGNQMLVLPPDRVSRSPQHCQEKGLH